MIRTFAIILIILFSISTFPAESVAQNNPDPAGAFVRSMVVPGWGHYYADSENWNRGKAHLGAELALIAGYFGLRTRASSLQEQYLTFANLRAGVTISERGRPFQLAIGEFNTLQEYNDFQLRSRNWNRLIDDNPENQWNWNSESDRLRYNELRSDRDRVQNQLPAMIGLMAVNRVVSALSAYNRARNASATPELSFIPAGFHSNSRGVIASVNFRF